LFGAKLGQKMFILLWQVKTGQLFVEEQQHNVEIAWQEQNNQVLQEIATLRGDEFNNTSMSVHSKNSKLLWDYFPPIYPCPLVWQVGRMSQEGDGGKVIPRSLDVQYPLLGLPFWNLHNFLKFEIGPLFTPMPDSIHRLSPPSSPWFCLFSWPDETKLTLALFSMICIWLAPPHSTLHEVTLER
jgi:hypothetical protein